MNGYSKIDEGGQPKITDMSLKVGLEEQWDGAMRCDEISLQPAWRGLFDMQQPKYPAAEVYLWPSRGYLGNRENWVMPAD